jgi:hypothetical protein
MAVAASNFTHLDLSLELVDGVLAPGQRHYAGALLPDMIVLEQELFRDTTVGTPRPLQQGVDPPDVSPAPGTPPGAGTLFCGKAAPLPALRRAPAMAIRTDHLALGYFGFELR